MDAPPAATSADARASAGAALARVVVLIPALDEEQALPGVLHALPRTGAGWHVDQVLVVDNGSKDRTAEVARAAGAKVVSEPRRGYGAACLCGLAALANAPPDIVCFLDGDGSDDPSELPQVLSPLVSGAADLVVGSRTLGAREPGALTPVQEWGNRLAVTLLRIGYGISHTDLGPFRAIRWRSLARLAMRDPDYGWTVEMQARAARAKLRTVEVPVRYRRRAAGKSKVAGTFRGAFGAGWKILTTIVRVRLGG